MWLRAVNVTLKQVLFGEMTIPVRKEGQDKRLKRYQDKVQRMEHEAAVKRAGEQDSMYEHIDD